jgi:hypothetical protein
MRPSDFDVRTVEEIGGGPDILGTVWVLILAVFGVICFYLYLKERYRW